MARAIACPPSSSEIRRKRLLFRSWHRGTREADLILGSFADAYLAGFDAVQLDRYEALLERGDPDIFDWLTGRVAPPPHPKDLIRRRRIRHRRESDH